MADENGSLALGPVAVDTLEASDYEYKVKIDVLGTLK
jgi:hypothetical protein